MPLLRVARCMSIQITRRPQGKNNLKMLSRFEFDLIAFVG